ncbi:MAG: DNA translocase FtsK [Aggregatilineales bacterium]
MAERDRRPTRAANPTTAAKSATGKTSAKLDPKQTAAAAKSATKPASGKSAADKDKNAKPKAAPKLVKRGTANATAKPASTGKAATTSAPRPRNSVSSQKIQVPLLFGHEPEQFGRLLHNRPSWLDELLAIGLIVIGLVLFVSPLGGTGVGATTLASTLSDSLRTLIGLGGMLVFAVLIMALGMRIVLMRLGIVLRLSWQRVIGVEVAYVAFLALLHLLAHDPEPRALARAGGGGGYVGWALSELLLGPFGSGLAILAFALILIVALGLSFGIRRPHIRQVLVWLKAHTNTLAARTTTRLATLTPPPPVLTVPDSVSNVPNPVSPAAPSRPSRRANAPMARPLNGSPANPPPASPLNVAPPRATTPPMPDAPAFTAPAPRSADVAQDRASIPINGVAAPAPATPKVVPSTSAPVPPPTAQPAPSTSKAPGSTRMVLSRPAPELSRRVKRFSVADFKESRRALKLVSGQPPITLLDETELNRPSEDEINTNARIIENTLLEFDIDVEVVEVKVGPTVTQYAVQPFREVTDAQGQVVTQRVRVNKISSLSSDLALALSAKRLRIQSYVPGHTYMGIEVPNRTPSIVALRAVMESQPFVQAFSHKDPENPSVTIEAPLVIPLGRDVGGASFVANLATMPHLLIAGTTGSGKSVCLTAITLALTLINSPDRVKLVMLDPKMVELTRFNGLPHLLGPVETDKERILGVLRWATREMDRRYKLLEVEAARNLEAYNRALGKKRKAEYLPYIVIIMDEIGDLMLSFPDETERTITRLAQMARAVGMHLIITTQRPSVDIITGLIKANFPARISFAVASGIDSRVILDVVGAETLMGRGDMLYLASDASEPQRIQGCYVSDEELDRVMAFWNQRRAESGANLPVAPWERGVTRREALIESDPLLEKAIEQVLREQEASASALQRQLGIDFPRAVRLMDMLQQLGITGIMRGDGRTRDVLVKPGTDRYKQLLGKDKPK